MIWIRRLAWAIAALLALWALAWLAVPPIVRAQLEQQLGAKLGRTVSVGDVAFSPWALRLTVSDLAVAAAPGAAASAPQLAIGRLQIDVDAQSLLRLAPVVEGLQIDAPRVRVARIGEGRYDIDDVLERLASGSSAQGSAEPPRFALRNFALRDGAIEFDDQPAGRVHRVQELMLTLPFASSLPSQAGMHVEPRLAFTLSGARFDSAAQALPFAASRDGRLELKVAALDLAPYLGYLPESLPVKLLRGRVDADLALAFAAPQGGTTSAALRGSLALADFVLAERSGAPLLEAARLSVALHDVQPLARQVALGAVRIEGLQGHVSRDGQGRLNLQRLAGGPAAASAAPAASAPAAPAAAPAWQASIQELQIAGARLLWNDAAVQPASAWVLDGIEASAQQLRWPAADAMPFALQATLRPQADAAATLGVLSVQGQANGAAASARFELSSLSIAAVAPYANAAQRVRVAGTGRAQGALEWAAAADSAPMRLNLLLDEVAIDALELDEPDAGRAAVRGDTLAARRVQLERVALDLARTAVTIGRVRLQQPELRLERGADGAWNVMRLAGPTPLDESARPLVRAAAEASWQLRLDDLALEGGRLSIVDALPAPGHAGAPVRLGVDALSLGLRDLRLNGGRLVSTPQLRLGARVVDRTPGRGREQPGQLDWRGRFGLEPLLLAGRLRAERLPVDALQAYAPHPLGLRLERAEAGFEGDIALRQDAAAQGVAVDVGGNLLLSDWRLVSLDRSGKGRFAAADRELLSWQALAVEGLGLTLRPGALPRLAVRDARLSDFFARLVLTEEGELNLRDVPPPRPGAAAAGPDAAASAVPAAAASTPRTTAPLAGARLPVELDFGGMRLVNGKIDFSDRFIKPNYSAALTDLNGAVGAFHSGRGESASLSLSGRVAGTGLLEIEGRLKPNAVPRELDVRAKATDLELAPLSAYSGKYAGYAIERGKLSVEVRYKVEPDGRLDASHQLVLNQLTFGERVESPSATKLPVRLAVALLKDANGVIDINLPVSGTLEDPQFSLGPLIWKVIVNLIAKAATAPFALLAGGGGPDLSTVGFVPGTADFAGGAPAVIDKVAKALSDRPALKMTVVGEADIDAEGEDFRQAMLEARLRQELRREQLRASGSAPAAEAPSALTGEQRARLVKAVYRDTDLPDKPRNLIGLKADIPPDEMEALLLQHTHASPEAMRALALQRGLAVRDALLAKGLPGERLFVGDPKVRASGSPDPAWTPQVRLTLDTR